MHCDTISKIWYYKKKRQKEKKVEKNIFQLAENTFQLDIKRMKQAEYLVQNFALFVDQKEWKDPLEGCLILAELFFSEIEKNNEQISQVICYDEIEKNKKDGKLSALLTVEEGAATKGNLSILHILYRLGVRMLTLTWNYQNELGYPNSLTPMGENAAFDIVNTVNGLTKRGIEFVLEMEQLGMIIDVSHLSDAGFYDVLKITSKPFVASHSNARSICKHRRNLSDDMIIKLAQRGGVLGINYEPSFLKEKITEEEISAGIKDVVAMILHIRKIAGCACIGLGSDFDGSSINQELKDVTYLPILEDALYHAGLSKEEVEGIFYKNVMNLYREIL